MNMSIATMMSVYARDHPDLLARALDSILAQEFTDRVESNIYLAVDGPISNALDKVILERTSRIHRVIRIESNSGLASALNNLIDQLGEEAFIFRMDADDYSHTNRYQLQLDFMRLNPLVDIVGTDIKEVNLSTQTHRIIQFANDHVDALDKICRRVPVAHPTVCFRRVVFEKVKNYPVEGTNEDVAMWFRCAAAGLRFGNVHQPLLDFTITPNFWKRRSLGKAFSEFSCYVRGIWLINGVTWQYLFPLLRLALRLAPKGIARLAYQSPILRGGRPKGVPADG